MIARLVSFNLYTVQRHYLLVFCIPDNVRAGEDRPGVAVAVTAATAGIAEATDIGVVVKISSFSSPTSTWIKRSNSILNL